MLTPIPVSKPPIPELEPLMPIFSGYGEGWFLSDYHGQKLVWHTGGWPGMVSRVTLVPGLQLGVVVLTNQESGAAFNAVTYRVLDAYLNPGRRPTGWPSTTRPSNTPASMRTTASQTSKRAQSQQQAFAAAGGYAGHLSRSVVWRCHRQQRERQAAHALQQDRAADRHDDAVAARHLHRALGRSRLECRCLRHVRIWIWMVIREVRMQPVSPLTDFSFDFQDLRLVPLKEAEASAKAD
jgi:hypothetical protein